MTKLLLALVFLLSVNKLVFTDSAAGLYPDIIKLTEPDENSANELAEKEKTEQDNLDKELHLYIRPLSALHSCTKSSLISTQQDEYIGFIACPCTPPPDVLVATPLA